MTLGYLIFYNANKTEPMFIIIGSNITIILVSNSYFAE